jgi:acyl carrier protein
MDINEATEVVVKTIKLIIKEDSINNNIELNSKTKLISDESILDSMGIVEVCVALEDFADEHGFEFDWTSETAMSKSKSMFRTVESLSKEFLEQYKNKK